MALDALLCCRFKLDGNGLSTLGTMGLVDLNLGLCGGGSVYLRIRKRRDTGRGFRGGDLGGLEAKERGGNKDFLTNSQHDSFCLVSVLVLISYMTVHNTSAPDYRLQAKFLSS
jgi:hypothetical protein